MMIGLLLISSFFLVATSALIYFYCVDRLVRFEYNYYKEDWIKDGKPYGYFGTFRESSYWTGCWSREACVKKWMKETPDWIQHDPKAMQRLNMLRRAQKFVWFSVYTFGAVFLAFLVARYEGWIYIPNE